LAALNVAPHVEGCPRDRVASDAPRAPLNEAHVAWYDPAGHVAWAVAARDLFLKSGARGFNRAAI
jgi:hypothetical protein